MAIRVLLCDVFGTVVDWRGSIVRAGESLAARTPVTTDWGRFADRWRAGYGPAMNRVRTDELPWMTIDSLHRMILEEIADEHGLAGLTEAEMGWLNRVWHRLDPWGDSIGGIERLRSRFVVASLSNGNVALLTNMAKRAGIHWDCVLSAELFGAYKPDPEVYRGAIRLLDCAPDEALMVAAHPGDLEAARQVGLKTAFVPRPLEHGVDGKRESPPEGGSTYTANDFHDLADQLLGDLPEE